LKTSTELNAVVFKLIDFYCLDRVINMHNDRRDTLHNGRLKRILCLMCIVVSNAALGQQLTTPAITGAMNRLPLDKTVETSLAPLTLRYSANLSELGVAGMGGSIYVGPSGVLLMDRVGKFYKIQGGVVEELGIRTPSNFDLFLKENPQEKIAPGVVNATSFAYDPNHQKIYAAHNQYLGGDRIRMVVSSIKYDAHKLVTPEETSWTTIFKGDPIDGYSKGTDASAGKVILVGNNLLLSTGFPGREDEKTVREVISKGSLALTPPQDVKSLHSKLIKISLKDNSHQIYGFGQRNSQGMVLLSSGEILSTDHGPQGGDEINRIIKGGNFGHPIMTYGTRYGTYDYAWPAELMDKVPKNQKFELPLFAFVPSIAINPIIEIKGFNQRFKGDLLVGALKAQSLYRLKYADGRIIFSEPIWIGHRIRDIFEFRNKIYLLTDDPHLITLEVDAVKLASNKTKDDKYFLSPTMQNKCMNCHSFDQTLPSSMAPKLSNLIGKRIGSDTFNRYSDGFKASNLVWTKDNLAKFLANPSELVPGTAMPKVNLNENEVNELVEILSSYR